MDRKKWYAIATIIGGATALAIYLAPSAEARESLKPLSVNAILTKSWHSLRRNPFGETLTYQNRLLPPAVNVAGLMNLPIPTSSVTTINLYENAPLAWRLEEMNANGGVTGVIARDGAKLVTYQGSTNERTVSTLPPMLRSGWMLWPLPRPGEWRSDWTATAARTRVGTLPAYAITLKPKSQHTLFRTVTYWFQGRYFIPLGIQVTARNGATVFEAKAETFTNGAPGTSANPPSAGVLTAWKASPALRHASKNLVDGGVGPTKVTFPAALGPLARTGERQADGNAVAVYGSGPGRVLVLSTPTRVWRGTRTTSFLKPIAGNKGVRGVTDGVFSVVTFKRNNQEITLMGSRTQNQLARWATVEWP